MIRFFVVVNYMVQKFSFCSNFYVDVFANIYLLHILIDSKTVFISWNMTLKLKSLIQTGTVIFHKKFLTPHVAVYLFDETWYSTSIYHLVSQFGGTILKNTLWGNRFYLPKIKEYSLMYISHKFHGVWMTKFFRRSVF